MSSAAKTPREIKGWHVLTAMLAFFGAVIAVNVVFVVFAVGSFPGEDVRRSYLQGVQYNETLAERRAQDALGWRAAADFVGDSRSAALEVELIDREGRPVNGAAVQGELRWPADARHDRTLAFESVGNGRYRAELGDLTEGRWRLRARAERGENARDFEAELLWRN
jgi:nitrogen fixation protein FixH